MRPLAAKGLAPGVGDGVAVGVGVGVGVGVVLELRNSAMLGAVAPLPGAAKPNKSLTSFKELWCK